MREDYMIRIMIISVKKKKCFLFRYFPFHFCFSVCIAQVCVKGPGMDNRILSKIECTTDLLVQFLETVRAPATHTAL